MDPDQDLARLGNRPRGVFILQHFRTAEGMDAYGFHGGFGFIPLVHIFLLDWV